MDFSIPDMTCGHCRASVTEALKGLDPTAKIEIDLEARRLRFEGTASAEAVIGALDEVGFDATKL